MRTLAISLTLFVLAVDLVQAQSSDPIQAALAAAKQGHQQAVQAARSDLVKAFEAAVKEIAATGDLNGVKALLSEKDAFDAKGQLPSAPKLENAVTAYRKLRQQADADLTAAYQAAVKQYTMALKIEEATAVDREFQDFREGIQDSSAPATGTTPSLSAADPMADARQKYHLALNEAKTRFLEAIDQRLLEVAGAGDLETVKVLQEMKETVTTQGQLAATADPKINAARNKYEGARRQAREVLSGAYRKTIGDLERSKKSEQAAKLLDDLQEGQNVALIKIPRLNLQTERFVPTPICGGKGPQEIKETAPPGGILVGLKVSRGKFINNDIVQSVQAIYQVEDEFVLGKLYGPPNIGPQETLMARPGYAVGGIIVRAGLIIDGVELVFMRIRGNRLDANDSYKSAFVGGNGGGETKLVGAGQLVVGIFGGYEQNVNGLGLIVNP